MKSFVMIFRILKRLEFNITFLTSNHFFVRTFVKKEEKINKLNRIKLNLIKFKKNEINRIEDAFDRVVRYGRRHPV